MGNPAVSVVESTKRVQKTYTYILQFSSILFDLECLDNDASDNLKT